MYGQPDHDHSEYAQGRDLDTLEQRIADLESEVRVQHAAIEGLDATLRALADQHI
jgi:hypothetical protein